MAHADAVYLDLCGRILKDGEGRGDRTGTGTISLFGPQMEFDLRDGFPLLTTKKINFYSIMHELFWFLRGDTNVNTLKAPQLWSPWANEDGGLGKIYGYQWTKWEKFHLEPTRQPVFVPNGGAEASRISGFESKPVHINQIADLIERIKTNPTDRRMIVSAWNVADLPEMALPPCHVMFQCYVSGEFLDLKMYQRSADMAIGVPFNIASYALLQEMLARECGLVARYFIHTFGDAHIYRNHVAGIKKQMDRAPLPSPRLEFKTKDFWKLVREDSPELIEVHNYDPHPFIKFELAV